MPSGRRQTPAGVAGAQPLPLGSTELRFPESRDSARQAPAPPPPPSALPPSAPAPALGGRRRSRVLPEADSARPRSSPLPLPRHSPQRQAEEARGAPGRRPAPGVPLPVPPRISLLPGGQRLLPTQAPPPCPPRTALDGGFLHAKFLLPAPLREAARISLFVLFLPILPRPSCIHQQRQVPTGSASYSSTLGALPCASDANTEAGIKEAGERSGQHFSDSVLLTLSG